MWSLFSRDPSKDFAYEVGEVVSGIEDQSIWKLHDGKRKGSGEPVSIFVFDVKSSSETQVAVAKTALKRIKTLRHPNILSYADGLETEKVLYVVTEPVVPLQTYIRNNEDKTGQNELAISWGLHQIAKGLSFLNNDCNLIHNNVCIACVFVDKAGEWKLGGVDFMYPASGSDCVAPVKILPSAEKYDPPEKTGGGGRFKPTEKWSTDMWGLGCLIWEVFNGKLPKNSSLKTLGKIPKGLVARYCELVGANPKSRPNPANFIENCRSKGGFMDNKFIATMLFLEEIQIKEASEKTSFFNGLSSSLNTFPEAFCRYKILPQLLHAFEYGNAGSSVLQPLFKLGKYLDSEEYQKKIVPCVVKLFSSTDRATRVKLLQQVELFVEHLTPDIVNNKIFPSICQGFMDTNPVVREHTIKSMLHLAAKLNYKNLNEELLKNFARLQSKDDQGGIRTNTTVCLGKIGGHINPQMRQKVLCSAYLRAMKDPFPPARQAGIVAMAATHNFFTLRESANRLLPSLCSMTMDPEKTVRDQAFKAIRCFIVKLEKVSENPEMVAELERDVHTGGSAASAAASWAGWAVSGMSSLTSKIYKGKGRSPPKQSSHIGEIPKTASEAKARPKKPPDSPKVVENDVTAPEEEEEEEETAAPEEGSTEAWNEENDGWQDDDDWGDMEEEGTATSQPTETSTGGDGWEEDDWGSIDDTKDTKQPRSEVREESPSLSIQKDTSPWGGADFAPVDTSTSANSTSSYNWGNNTNDDAFFNSLISDNTKTNTNKPAQGQFGKSTSSHTTPLSFGQTSNSPSEAPAKTTSSANWDTGGWEDNWGANNAGQNKTEKAKKEREEKRTQRQRELEEKRAARQASGSLKLGAKKLPSDW